MPNWNSNELVLTGDKDKIEAAIADICPKDERGDLNDDEIHFGVAVPMPEGLKDGSSPYRGDETRSKYLISLYGSDNWYDWAVKNWGTKWSHMELEAGWDEREPDNASWIGSFETAWGPPEEWLKKLAPKHPDVTFSLAYAEPGMGFEGVLTLKGDEALQDKSRDIDEDFSTPLHGRIEGQH